MLKLSSVSLAVMSLFAVASANAADIRSSTKDSDTFLAPAKGFSWDGFYIGAHGGTFDGDVDLAWPTTPDQGFDNGWHAGAQVGYNRQLGAIVLGVEADASLGDLSTDTVKDGNYITQDSELDAFGTIRGRLGVALGRVLPYVTGGVAWGMGSTGEHCPAKALFGHCSKTGAYDESDDFTAWGWAYGAGVEYAVTDRLSAKIEYLRLDFNDEDVDPGKNASARNVELEADLIRFGLNYKLGGSRISLD